MRDLRIALAQFVEDSEQRIARAHKSGTELATIRSQQANVTAYLSDSGFIEHLVQHWLGPDQVVAIIEGEDGNVRASLVKRVDAFSFSEMKDTFAETAWLVMSADPNGVLFQELGPIPVGSA